MVKAREPSTFCTALVWDEAAFDYMRIVDCTKHQDARAEYLAMHAPPMWIIESVRYDGKVFKP